MTEQTPIVTDMPEVRVRPLRRAEYDVLVEQDAFEPDERIQLLDGELVLMRPQEARHAGIVEALTERLMPGLVLAPARPRAQGPHLRGRGGAGVVPEYWVIDVAGGVVHVHTDPTAEGYATVTRHAEDESLDACGVTLTLRDLRSA
jgi:Uma2 family endonuclease